MAGDKIGVCKKIRGLYRLRREAKMAYRDAARFLRVIGKVSLGIHIGIFAYDLYGVLVSPYCPIGAQAPKLAPDRAFNGSVNGLRKGKRTVAYIVVYPYRKMVFGRHALHIVKYGLHHGRRKILASKTVASSDYHGKHTFFLKDSAYILIEGFPKGSRGLYSVKDSDSFGGGRNDIKEMLRRERMI